MLHSNFISSASVPVSTDHDVQHDARYQASSEDTTWRSEYTFAYMPDGFLCRLMCRLFAWSGVVILESWKFGGVLEKSGHRCYFSRSEQPGRKNVVVVHVVGPNPQNLATLVSSKMQALRKESFLGVQVSGRQGSPIDLWNALISDIASYHTRYRT